MASSALSSRRRYLRRPKVCRTLPNPGRCEPPPPPPPPPACPPLVLTGWFEFTGLPDCHGEDHHSDFTAPYMPDTENPWIYFNDPPDDIDADGVYFELYEFAPRKPWPHLHAAPWSKRVDPPKYCDAVRWALPITWCINQSHTIDTWDVISSGMSAILFLEW